MKHAPKFRVYGKSALRHAVFDSFAIEPCATRKIAETKIKELAKAGYTRIEFWERIKVISVKPKKK